MLSLGTSLGVSSITKQTSDGTTPPPGETYTLVVPWTQVEGGVNQESAQAVYLSTGAWAVTIHVENFVTSNYGSHGLSINGYASEGSPPSWQTSSSNDFAYISTIDPSALFFGLNDPNQYSYQDGYGEVSTSFGTTTFTLYGRLPNAGDTANFTITFTRI